MDEHLKTICQYVSSWKSEDKEGLFWYILNELSSDCRRRIMLFTIFTKQEVEERFHIKLTGSQFDYLKKNFLDFVTFERDHIGWLIEGTLFRM